ncbi:MAG: YdcF family protein [Acidobacteriia bacterium]|nr:YdcF family protein [Terriglobia bacterium]
MKRRGEHGGIFFRLLFLLVFIAFFAFLYVVRHPLMRLAGEFWVLNDPAASADVIIVLGDDNYAGDRAFHAAELYRSGVAPVVVASGRMLRANVSVADLIGHDLESFGIPASAVVRFSQRASNTKQEAEALSGLIARSGWKRILIVTSNYHARRAEFIFDRVLPPGLSLHVSAARDSEFNPSDWWETRTGQKLFLDELLGYTAARWELRGHSAGGGAAVLSGIFTRRFEKRLLNN